MELCIDRLTKRYGTKIAVDRFSTTLTSGVYGLLGANGSGKTTLMRMMADVLMPTSGDITLDGVSIYSLDEEYRDLIGYLPQNFGYYKNFSAMDFLLYLAAVKGLDKRTSKEKSMNLLSLVGLEHDAKNKVRTFSGGMRQRLGIAQALLNDPSILILDEPTAGLDPKERIRFRNLISDISADRIVLFSTHIVSDIESISKEVLMMKKGNLLRHGTPDDTAMIADGKVWEITLPSNESPKIKNEYTVSNIRHSGNQTQLRIVSEERPYMDAVPVVPSLEDAYLYCFGEE